MKNRKLLTRILAGTLAGLMILGAITITIMNLFPHAHLFAFGGLPF